MNRFLLVSLLCAFVAVDVAAESLDLLSRAELRRVRMEANGVRRMAPAIGVASSRANTKKIGAFVRLKDGFTVEDLAEQGITVLSCRDGLALCMVPVDSAEVLAESAPVRNMQIERKVHTSMNRARAAIGLDDMHAGLSDLTQAYQGEGVIAAVVDQGIDPNHLNFKNPDGTSRFGYLYSIDYSTSNSDGYVDDGYWGEEVKKFTTDTKEGYHGTHTLGILAGNYQGKITMPDESQFVSRDQAVPVIETDNPFRGAAPKAELAAAACSYLTDMFIAYGIEQMWIHSEKSNKPEVLSLSLGSNVGPHDINSQMNQYLDLITKKSETVPNPPIVCVSAGNEGDHRIALRKTLTSSSDKLRTMIWPYYYNAAVEGSTSTATVRTDQIAIYSSDTTKLTVQAVLYNKKRNYNVAARMPVIGDGVGAYYLSSTDYQVSSSDMVNTSLEKYFYGYVGLGGMIDTDVNRYYAMIDYGLQNNEETNHDDNYVLGFEVSIAEGETIPEGGITVDCYCSGEYTEMYNYGQDGFDNGSRNGSISDMAICPQLIVVGSYNTRDEWLCLDGMASRYESTDPDYFTIGKASGFSSFGTLSDGRNLPTVCAPGATIISSVNRYYTELSEVKDQAAQYYQAKAVDSDGRINYWKQEPGTSMSTPLVAGAIACWLEADPDLTYADVQDIIAKTAVVDDDVRSGDPVQWGAGKFDALAGLKEVIRRKGAAGVNELTADESRLIMSAVGNNVYKLFLGGFANVTADVVNAQGARVMHATAAGDELTLDLNGLSRGVYIISANGNSRKVLVK
jgi:subtilisin family serine protease